MNDIKKVLIAAICVVLAVAIAAGVSIGVLAGTVNGMKDQIAELNQTVDALESQNSAMKAEIEEAAKNNEGLVSAAEFEAKLAEALGAQTQTMQAMISTAVKNQIEELGVEGLTEAQVQTIIDAAVANCLTEDDIDAIVANANTGLAKDEVKKLITDYTAGYLTYGQIVNMIDDADYDLRAYLEKKMATMKQYLEDKISGVQDGLTTEIEIYAEDAINGVYTIDSALVANLVNADYSAVVLCEDDDWSAITVQVDSGLTKSFYVDVTTDVKKVVLGADSVEVYVYENVEVETFVVNAIDTAVYNSGTIGELIAEDCGNDDDDNNTIVYNSAEIDKYTDNADGCTVTLEGNNPEEWAEVYGTVKYAFADYGATVTISGEGAVANRMFDENEQLVSVVIAEGVTAIGNRSFRRCYNLASITLPESLETIDEAAFQSCTALTSIVIPEGVESIGEQAFYGAGLTSIVLPESLTTIASSGIRATNLSAITIPAAVTSIGGFAFRDSESLETVCILCEDADAFTIAGDAFLNAATPYPDMTIFVVNQEMKDKVEASLTGYTAYITVELINNVSSADELANTLAAGGYAVLDENVEATNIIDMGQGGILDGNDKTLETSANRGIAISASGKNTVIQNLDIASEYASTYTSDVRGITINNGDYEGATLTISNCTIDLSSTDWAYGINMPAGVNGINIVIDNCTIEGAIALNIWGDNNTITVTNSTLICNYTTNSMYWSSCVRINNDGTYIAENNTISFTNCSFEYNGVNEYGWEIEAVTNYGENNTVTITDCTVGENVVFAD